MIRAALRTCQRISWNLLAADWAYVRRFKFGWLHSKYARICAYFLSPIPLTFFKSSALLNGRAAIIRAAITWPIPGTIVNSFSVAVLMSTLPNSMFSLPCDLLPSLGLLLAIAGFAVPVTTLECEALSEGGREELIAQPPSFLCFASRSSYASF